MASCFIISLMERHERWHLTHESQWRKIFLWKVPSHYKIGKLWESWFFTHRKAIVIMLHISWMIVPTEVKPFVLWQLFITLWNFLGEKLGEFCFHCNKCVFFKGKKLSLLKKIKSLKRKLWEFRYKEFKIKLPNNCDIGLIVA